MHPLLVLPFIAYLRSTISGSSPKNFEKSAHPRQHLSGVAKNGRLWTGRGQLQKTNADDRKYSSFSGTLTINSKIKFNRCYTNEETIEYVNVTDKDLRLIS